MLNGVYCQSMFICTQKPAISRCICSSSDRNSVCVEIQIISGTVKGSIMYNPEMHNLNNNIMDQEYEFTFVNQLFKAYWSVQIMGKWEAENLVTQYL